MPLHPTGSVTLVFTDLEGSSELSEKFGAAFEAARMEHFGVLRAAAADWGGYEVETAGDALFVVFQGAADAVRFAVEAQLGMAAHPWPEIFGELRVRIGLHSGEPFIGDDGGRPTYRGPATNRAARVQAAGHGGQILVSDATAQSVAGQLPSEISLRDCGPHRLKGVGEERLWQVVHPQLRDEFPPLATLNPQRHNLPAPPAPLVGREGEVEACRAVLCASPARLLTVTGFGGLGKTRLALQVAELCVPEFADGVWWVELDEARSAAALVRAIALALRFVPQPQAPLEEQVENYLRPRQLLLVLDNTEQIADAPRAISRLLDCAPGLKCLITTRRALNLRNETLREVPPLPPGDAVRLFTERAAARRNDFALSDENSAAIAEICRRLEGVPLALELAASRIASLSPHDVLRHLDQRFKVLQSRAPDLPPRQRALRGAIDWSHDLLHDDDKTLFAQLAVFRHGFTLGDAEKVCAVFDVFEGVQELRGQSLLRVETSAEGSRFAMLESVREYAMEKLEAEPEMSNATRSRHAAHFLEHAEAQIAALRTPGEVDALARFEAALDNVRAAFDWAQSCGESENAARLALALGIFFQRRSLLNDAVRAIENGLQCAAQLPEARALQAQLWRERAGLHLDKLEPAESRRCVERALEFAPEGDFQLTGEVHNLLGLAAKREKNFGAARQEFAQSLEAFRAVGQEAGIGIVLSNLGATECEDANGDRAAAAQFLHDALALRRKLGDLRGVAEVLNNLGCLAQEQNRLDEANAFYRDALEVETRLRNTIGTARALHNLSEIAETNADFPRAWRYSAAAEHLFTEAGSPLQRHATELRCRVELQTKVIPALPKNDSLQAVIGWAMV